MLTSRITRPAFSHFPFQYRSCSTATPLTRDTRYLASPQSFHLPESGRKRDVIIIGAGHNGLTAASYLAKAGLDVLVLERRDKVGGAAVTEEIFDGFHFSRASYLAGLLRPKVLSELQLKEKYGLEFIVRNPSSFTPTKLSDAMYGGKHLMFWNGDDGAHQTYDSIAQFSVRDAQAMEAYEAYLSEIRDMLQPFLDHACPDVSELDFRSLLSMATKSRRNSNTATALWEILGAMKSPQTVTNFVELMTSPASKILHQFFESEILKTTLATDAVIGSTLSPGDTGSAYVLLHHVMGESEGMSGVWSYAKGGMGAISAALAQCATDFGAEIVCNADVQRIMFDAAADKVSGVRMRDGTEICADYVLSNCTPYHTFVELFDAAAADDDDNTHSPFDATFMRSVESLDYQCGAFKVNLVVSALPNFECLPNDYTGGNGGVAAVGPQHTGTIHFESRMHELETASFYSKQGIPAPRPIIEMTIPSALDASLITDEDARRAGYHVVQLFVQHAPYTLNAAKCGGARDWDADNGAFKQQFVDNVLRIIDEFAPGFSASVVHCDALSPRDLERIFGLYKGNIFHGAISLDQIGWNRPVKHMMGNYRTPLRGLYMCGAGAHPGGGVMGAPGRNCANQIKAELKLK